CREIIVTEWQALPGQNSFKLLYHSSMSWDDAQNYCRIKHWGLASVLHDESHRNIHDLLEPTGAQSSWLGLRRTDTRQWRWSDGSGTLQVGSRNCVSLHMQYSQWNSVSCETPYHFVCYSKSELQMSYN
uniref:C-type lectin domain-containing protein n=1 Tax=Neogobius melanostomus TaxID=47308 RepID=A0A8C6SAS6_9GOBI